jgi:hypothetical protein
MSAVRVPLEREAFGVALVVICGKAGMLGPEHRLAIMSREL